MSACVCVCVCLWCIFYLSCSRTLVLSRTLVKGEMHPILVDATDLETRTIARIRMRLTWVKDGVWVHWPRLGSFTFREADPYQFRLK